VGRKGDGLSLPRRSCCHKVSSAWLGPPARWSVPQSGRREISVDMGRITCWGETRRENQARGIAVADDKREGAGFSSEAKVYAFVGAIVLLFPLALVGMGSFVYFLCWSPEQESARAVPCFVAAALVAIGSYLAILRMTRSDRKLIRNIAITFMSVCALLMVGIELDQGRSSKEQHPQHVSGPPTLNAGPAPKPAPVEPSSFSERLAAKPVLFAIAALMVIWVVSLVVFFVRLPLTKQSQTDSRSPPRAL
jgi:hypothetical protein